MAENTKPEITREKLIDALNEDLSREYQAIIAYVNYSQVLKGAAYMNIADELASTRRRSLTTPCRSPITSTISAACRP
jgi:bacterioferritin